MILALIAHEIVRTYAIPCPNPNIIPYVIRNAKNDLLIVQYDRKTPALKIFLLLFSAMTEFGFL